MTALQRPDAPESVAAQSRVLATLHALSDQAPRPVASYERLSALPDWLYDTSARLASQPTSAKAGEWVMDNQYVVDRAAFQIREGLPSSYYSQLPSLAIDDRSLPPRIYELARDLLLATRFQLTLESIVEYVSAYQQLETLELAELWALPTMLRLSCLEALVLAACRLDPDTLAPFELKDTDNLPAGLDETECIARSVRCLSSLNGIAWGEFVEATSAIDELLRRDPAGVYSTMDKETQDRYRSTVEELARGSNHTEREVARRALALARGPLDTERATHVGYWLIAEGREQLEQALLYNARGRRWLQVKLQRHATGIYLGALVAFTACFLSLPAIYLILEGAAIATWVAVIPLLVLSASMPALALLHRILLRLLDPAVLPKLAFENGIPPAFKTAVTIPSLITSPEDVRHRLAQIERHHLANPDPQLQFVLLTGYAESETMEAPSDAVLLDQLVDGVHELNERYGPEGPFHLLHRERRFNPVEDRWMGWERKRGKLHEFNDILRHDEETSFRIHHGAPQGLEGIRYVITLDADTALPGGTAARLVGTLAHPLNRAEEDPVSGKIRAGYTVVQPRVEVTPESGNQSRFTRLFCGDTAVDIYSRAVSDLYQDLFGTGIYVGKAIYDVVGFSKSLEGRFPENALVSHDLFEGIHGRVGLATDVVLFEDYPPTYFAFARRLHRWVRGDWQLIPWLRRSVPSYSGPKLPNCFTPIDRWKIVDNLRRSLIPAILFALFISGWTWLPGDPLIWTLMMVLAPSGHLFIDIATGVVRERFRTSRDLGRSILDQGGRWLLFLVFLPHQAWVTADAIVRTLFRVIVTRRNLLEWTTSAQAAAFTTQANMGALAWRTMAIAPLSAVVTAAVLAVAYPGSLPAAIPLLVLWLVSPEVARRISRPTQSTGEELDQHDADWLRTIARRTWFFFETFVGPDGHWLPPDNYQEDPVDVVAERTSPTNIGMLLLSTFAAFDLGYIGMEQLTARLRHTLRTIDDLEHYRGHLLNWYDIRSLAPLEPRYVSTVDSGNLAAALFALDSGLSELVDAPVLAPARWDGLVDTITIMLDDMQSLVTDPVETSAIRQRGEELREITLRAQAEPRQWFAMTVAVDNGCREIESLLVETITARRDSVNLDALRNLRLWLATLHRQVADMQREMAILTPWLRVLDSMPSIAGHEGVGADLSELSREIGQLLAPTTPLGRVRPRCHQALATLSRYRQQLELAEPADDPSSRIADWLDELDRAVRAGVKGARQLQKDLTELSDQAHRQTSAMDFGWLYDARVHLLFLGYNITADQMDPHHYDLLASEARLASFVAIAKGDVPHNHWFSLGRPITNLDGVPSLLSWGGTMFEYLMPPLLLRSQPGTLLDTSQRAAAAEQMADGKRRKIPWGVSESSYAAFDADHNYQYHAFGVQTLGRKRGLENDRVVAPYATALALPLFPSSATNNLRRLDDLNMVGMYGFYEAIDFTPSRLPTGRSSAMVTSYMSHHQGMILAALDNVLSDDALVGRFEANPRVQATGLVLQERVPAEYPVESVRRPVLQTMRATAERPPALVPWRPDPDAAKPAVHVLGNGQLSSLVTETGGGALSWRGQSLTRSNPDGTLHTAGLWMYVRDEQTGATWSVGALPTGRADAMTDVVFHAHLVELHRRQNQIAVRTDVVVAAGDDIEVRLVTVVNESDRPRSIALASYGEVVLAPARDDARHPAFSKLFVESTHLPELNGLLFTRTGREPDERAPVLMHRLVADRPSVTFTGFDSDRARFVDRNETMRNPRGAHTGLSGSVGDTLDPIMALSATVELEPFGTEQLAFVTIAGSSIESVYETASRFETLTSFQWLIADALAEATREAARLKLEPGRLPELERLLSHVLAPTSTLRQAPSEFLGLQLGQPDLWGLGISGDDPLILVTSEQRGSAAALRDLLRAHQLWRRRGVAIDLVVLSHDLTGYQDETRDEVHRLLGDLGTREWLGRRGGIHLVRSDQITSEQQEILAASASAILNGNVPLGDQLKPEQDAVLPLPPLLPSSHLTAGPDLERALDRPADLLFDNGIGGFTPDGREYVIHLEPGQTTPAPWCNVLANDEFGTLVTESGGGYTWAGNSGEFRLTPWTNDPVLDPPGESLYLRDEETVEVWSLTPGPAGSDTPYQIRHGAGYSEWHNTSHGLETQVRVFVPTDDPVKLIELRVRNQQVRPRRLTATYYAQWLLGTTFKPGASPVVVDYDSRTCSLRARNHWNPDFAGIVAFLTAEREVDSYTADRVEFFGHDGDPRQPAALRRVGLAGTTRTSVDPCGCIQIHLELGPGEEIRTHFVLGAGTDEDHATKLAHRWRKQTALDEAADQLSARWDTLLSTITVKTPEPAMDLLVNRWALYQVLSSRLLARTGFYQSSGAFGFRDQLQDVLAITHCEPARTRAQILECASRQFEEGDVLHWWHPPAGRGVRTRCSDDLLWLPYATAHYVKATGDCAILDEQVPFLSAPPLAPTETGRYDTFRHGDASGSLFEHCRRALQRGLTQGPQGLPLIGEGDWNDGMNLVGARGRGESVWLGWFAGAAASDFATLCERRGDTDAATAWRSRAHSLFETVESEGWDGDWYRRAFDDDGRPWGSHTSQECEIDSIAQSWAILSGGANPERAARALESAATHLVRTEDQLACLLWPPFDITARDPGYIKAYPPGIRENGGQYSHAAAWLGWAFAQTGDGDSAAAILRMINPIERTQSPAAIERYRLEPYAIAADIASAEPHVGRGGWSWYTGAAGWSWRLAVEAILGLRWSGDQLRIEPQLPHRWPGYQATIRTEGGVLEIAVDNSTHASATTTEIWLDGAPIEGKVIDLPTSGSIHQITVRTAAQTDK